MACTRSIKILLITLCLIASPLGLASSIWVLELRGAVGPASADYIIRGISEAEAANADLIVLKMDTPGGLDTAMRQIIKAIIASKVPVASYVSPSGSRAASAGTYILYASHIAAMAPATNLGAATPVQIGAPSLPASPKQDNDGDKNTPPVNPANAMQKKAINDAVAYIQGLASLHDRNALWAEKAVREAASLSAQQALEENVIDIIANDIDDLLQQIHDRPINMGDSKKTLALHNPSFHHYEPDWRNEFLTVITDPNVAYILMMIGIYGLLLEAYNPGTMVPGVVGAVSLLLAMYAFQVLPVSYAGLALIILGVMLMITEAFAPSFGILGLGGISSFIIGSIILMDTDIPAYQLALPVILSFACASVLILVFLLSMIMRARKQDVVSGLCTLEGQTTTVVEMRADKAMVLLQGEFWQINCDSDLISGDTVKIIAATGVCLDAVKLQEKTS